MQFATKHPVRDGILAILREHELGHRLDPGALDRSPSKGGFQSAALVLQSVDRQIDRYALPVELQHRHGARLVADEVTLIENNVRDVALQEKQVHRVPVMGENLQNEVAIPPGRTLE